MLPIPFLVACVAGIGVMCFMVFSSGNNKEKTAVNPAQEVIPTQASANLPPASSSQFRFYKQGVERSASSSFSSATEIESELAAKDEAQLEATTEGNLSSSEVVVSEISVAEIAGDSIKQAKTEDAVNELVASTDDTTTRRRLERVKTSAISAASQTTGGNAYSPENPDPSKLIATMLKTKTGADDQLNVTEPEPVMPPGVELNEDETEIPKLEVESADSFAELEEETPETEPAAGAIDQTEQDEPESVVTGELETETDGELETGTEPISKPIRIYNPGKNKLPVWFVINKSKIQLKPGQYFQVTTEDSLKVRYARGGEFGVGNVVTREGDYEFSVSRQAGWKLTEK